MPKYTTAAERGAEEVGPGNAHRQVALARQHGACARRGRVREQVRLADRAAVGCAVAADASSIANAAARARRAAACSSGAHRRFHGALEIGAEAGAQSHPAAALQRACHPRVQRERPWGPGAPACGCSRAEAAAEKILADAKALEQAGCFALVLECVPQMLGRKISQTLSIPTIGIGAGPFTDGQVLVLQDLLGMQADFKPKFLRHYMAGHRSLTDAVNHFHSDVAAGAFPTCQEAYQ